MAYFNVTLETIKTSEKHPNADKLSVCTLEGLPFTFVTGLNQFKVWETCIYIPIDSIVPDNLAEKLGVLKKLSGKNKDRVKTCTIRGIVSQGIVGKFSILEPYLINQYGTDWADKCLELKPSEITEWLGVTKYEPPAILEREGANLKPLPMGLSVYDIEGIDRNLEIYGVLKIQPVYISEKVEGSNFSVTFDGERFFVNQRRFTIEPLEGHEHTWWKVAKEQGLMDFVRNLHIEYNAPITVYGEMLGPGIQGNIYKLVNHQVRTFDIKVGESFMDAQDFLRVTERSGVLAVPNLGIFNTVDEFLQGKTVIEASNGKSVLNPNTLREGIVIKPLIETSLPKFGRLILKQRDPIYLAGTDN